MKFKYILIVILGALFFSTDVVFAALSSDSCANGNANCLKMCEYTNNSNISGIRIYYDLDDGSWELTWKNRTYSLVDTILGGPGVGWDSYNKRSKNPANVFYDNGMLKSTESYAGKGITDSLTKNGICPAFAAPDYSENSKKVCLDVEDAPYCSGFGSGWFDGTDFSSKQDLTYSLEEELKNYYSPKIAAMDILDLRGKSTEEINAFARKTLDDIMIADLLGHQLTEISVNVPDFIEKNPAFKVLLEQIIKKYENVQADKIAAIDAQMANDSLTAGEMAALAEQKAELEKIRAIFANQLVLLASMIGNDSLGSGKHGNIDCEYIFRNSDGSLSAFGKIVTEALDIMKFLAPVFVLIFSSIDFIKAVVSQDKDELKKATMKLTKRLILAVCVFFVAVVIDVLFGYFDITNCPLGE